MKVRAVVVWLLDSVFVGVGPGPRRAVGPKFKNRLDFDAVISDTKSAADQLLKSVGEHPENLERLAGSVHGELREMGAALGSMLAQAQSVMPQPTPGTRWHNECVEFTTAKGELLLIPRERIAWIELGPEREA
jgi:hypothetical protein